MDGVAVDAVEEQARAAARAGVEARVALAHSQQALMETQAALGRVQGAAALERPVSEHMTEKVETCGLDDSVAVLMRRMTVGKFRHMPVVDAGRLVGIISIGDVVKQRIAEAEAEASAMREYITA